MLKITEHIKNNSFTVEIRYSLTDFYPMRFYTESFFFFIILYVIQNKTNSKIKIVLKYKMKLVRTCASEVNSVFVLDK